MIPGAMTTILLLTVVGVLALVAELVLPGGILGVAGVLCFVAAAVRTFTEFGPAAGITLSAVLTAFSLALLWLWMRHFHRLPFTRKLILLAPHRGDAPLPSPDDDLAGRTGLAITDLAPSGRVLCGDRRIDALAEASAIAEGESVILLRRSGPGWIVRPAPPPEDQVKDRR